MLKIFRIIRENIHGDEHIKSFVSRERAERYLAECRRLNKILNVRMDVEEAHQ